MGFWIGRNQTDGEFFSGVLGFFCWIVSGLPPWVCLTWACILLVVGFFFFFLIVMIFHKPHNGGWVLRWVRQNVGFGGCSRS